VLLNRLKVLGSIYLGFGLLVALALGVAGFGVFQFSAVGQQNRTAEAVAGNERRVLEATHALETVRRAETHYRLDADDASLKERGEAAARVSSLMTESAAATLSEERRRIYNGLQAALKAHDDSFARLVALTNTINDANTKLDAGGAALATATTHLMAAARASQDPATLEAAAEVERSLLAVRVANWRFQALYDPKGPAAFKKAVAKAQAAIASVGESTNADIKALAAPVGAGLDDYAASFAIVSDATLASIDLDNQQMAPQIVAMQQELGKAEVSLTAAFDASGTASRQLIDRASLLQQVLAGIVLVLGTGLAIIIGRSIARPIAAMTAAMTRLAGGDKTIEIPARGRGDEIGDMARAVEVFLQQAIENARLAAEREREQAAKERRQVAMDNHTKDFGSSVSGVMASFMASAATMRQAASDVGESVRQTRASTSSTVEGATASARDLNSVAAAAEQMAASIKEISKQVTHVSTSVQVAVDRAAETDAKVAGLSETADRIGDVVRLINDVAGQTNLLALNATIEAARAGEAGRGFAVVAGEVKALAAQTARATEQIGTQIVAIRGATADAVTAVREVGVAIGEVVRVATAIAAAVEQQAAATQEISNSVQMVTVTTSAASEEMRAVLVIAEKTDETSGAALAAAEEVGRTADTLRSEVADFLAAMSGGDDADRRRYERVDANGATATLKAAHRAAVQVTIRNISRGGMAVQHDSQDQIGTDLDIVLPGDGAIKGRIARGANGILAIAFRQDEASLRAIDRAMEVVARGPLKQAA